MQSRDSSPNGPLIPTPPPVGVAVSVLIVAEVASDGERFDLGLAATVAATAEQLASTAHEILVALPDEAAALRLRGCLGVAMPNLRLVIAPPEQRLGVRWQGLRGLARGDRLLVLGSGAVPMADAITLLCAAADDAPDQRVFRPRFRDPSGLRLAGLQASGACLLIDARSWPREGGHCAGFHTAHLFDQVVALAEKDGTFREHEIAVVMTGGWADRALQGNGEARRFADLSALRRGPQGTTGGTLLVCLGDPRSSLAATGAIADLAAAAAGGVLGVLTSARDAWMFARNEAVSTVMTPVDEDSDAAIGSEDPWFAEAAAFEAQRTCGFGRLVFADATGFSNLRLTGRETTVQELRLERGAALARGSRDRTTSQLRATAMVLGPGAAEFVIGFSSYSEATRVLCHGAAAESCRRRKHLAAVEQHLQAITTAPRASTPARRTPGRTDTRPSLVSPR